MDIIYCVETAIRNTFDLGYKVVIPVDMVAGNAKSQDLNEKTFKLVRKTYGEMTSSSELIDIWNKYLKG
jgi:nicotinamidase-related amidase